MAMCISSLQIAYNSLAGLQIACTLKLVKTCKSIQKHPKSSGRNETDGFEISAESRSSEIDQEQHC
jgi:hypothetical protein